MVERIQANYMMMKAQMKIIWEDEFEKMNFSGGKERRWIWEDEFEKMN